MQRCLRLGVGGAVGLLALCLVTADAWAQHVPLEAQRKWALGGELSVARATLETEPAPSSAIRTLGIGFIGLLRLAPSWSVQGELRLVQRGAERVEAIPDIGVVTSFRELTFLDAVASVRAVSPWGRYVRPYLAAGVGVSLLVVAKTRFTGPGFPDRVETDRRVARFDLGGDATAGVELPAGGGVLTLGLRLWLGLRDVDLRDDQVARNRVLSATLGYLF